MAEETLSEAGAEADWTSRLDLRTGRADDAPLDASPSVDGSSLGGNAGDGGPDEAALSSEGGVLEDLVDTILSQVDADTRAAVTTTLSDVWDWSEMTSAPARAVLYDGWEWWVGLFEERAWVEIGAPLIPILAIACLIVLWRASRLHLSD